MILAAVLSVAALWTPAPTDTVQVQLAGKVDTSVAADVFYIDGDETPAATVAALHAKGAHVACYFSAGSYENYRADAKAFPPATLGKKLSGYPDERWLDVRRIGALMPIMERRLDECVAKGFDAADFDNVDGYQNKTGFPIKGSDQLRYNRRLAAEAHERGLSASLKNDVGQVGGLAGDFDFALNEQCLVYKECQRYKPFVDAGKAVFHIEYREEWKKPCGFPGLSSIRKTFPLRARPLERC
jgi:hypothetical protein